MLGNMQACIILKPKNPGQLLSQGQLPEGLTLKPWSTAILPPNINPARFGGHQRKECMEHSKLPWALSGIKIVDAERKTVFDAATSNNSYSIDGENFRLIVQTVNSHQQLVDACKMLLGCMHAAGWENDPAAIHARAALAAAGAA